MNQLTEEDPTTSTSSTQTSGAAKAFDPNIRGVVCRLHVGSGQVLFCDAIMLTERDLVVTIPRSEAIPDRGESVQCSLFLVDDDAYCAKQEGIVHWEMAMHGQRLAGIFLTKSAPKELVRLADKDQRREVRFPANLACRVIDKTESINGRLVNYSLSGLATQMPQPMSIGENYTIELDAGDEQITVEATCRWSIETSYGFVNGCSLANEEGRLLARRVFRGTVMPWDISRTRRRTMAVTAEVEEEYGSSVGSDEAASKPVISTTTILLLSAMLIGLSIKTPEQLTDIAFLAGMAGLVTYIGLVWTARMRKAIRDRKVVEAKRAVAEDRLEAHVSTNQL